MLDMQEDETVDTLDWAELWLGYRESGDPVPVDHMFEFYARGWGDPDDPHA